MKIVTLYALPGCESPLIVDIEAGDCTPEEIVKVVIEEIEDCTKNDVGVSEDIKVLNDFKETMVAWVKASMSSRAGRRISLSSGASKITIYTQTDLNAEGISRAL